MFDIIIIVRLLWNYLHCNIYMIILLKTLTESFYSNHIITLIKFMFDSSIYSNKDIYSPTESISKCIWLSNASMQMLQAREIAKQYFLLNYYIWIMLKTTTGLCYLAEELSNPFTFSSRMKRGSLHSLATHHHMQVRKK